MSSHDAITATIEAHYRRQATPEVWEEIDALRYRAANMEETLKHVQSRVFSLMRAQEEDCKVNGPNHPGLLEPMRDCLRGLHAELQLLTGEAAPAKRATLPHLCRKSQRRREAKGQLSD